MHTTTPNTHHAPTTADSVNTADSATTPRVTGSLTGTLFFAYWAFCFLVMPGIIVGYAYIPKGWSSLYWAVVPLAVWAFFLSEVFHQGTKDGVNFRAWIYNPVVKESAGVKVGVLAAGILPVLAQLAYLWWRPPRDTSAGLGAGAGLGGDAVVTSDADWAALSFDYPSFLHDPEALTRIMLILPTFIVLFPLVQEILWRGVLTNYLVGKLRSPWRGYLGVGLLAFFVQDDSILLPDGDWLMALGGIYLIGSVIAQQTLRAYSRTLAPCIAANMLSKTLFILLVVAWVAQHT